jgi:hypothetical protein
MSTSDELNEDLLIELLINDVGGVIDFIGYIAADGMRMVPANELGPVCRSRLRVGRPRGRSSNSGRGKMFLLFTPSRLVLVPTKLHIQWAPGALSPGREAHHFKLVPRLRVRGSIHQPPPPIRLHGVVPN